MGTSTIPPERPIERIRRARGMRRAFLVLLFAFVAAGLIGVFGVRTGTVRGSGGGYQLEVRYAKVARPGLSVPWAVTIRRPGGFEGPVTLTTTAAYFDMLDENSFDPEPVSSTADGEDMIWEFEPPDQGDTLEISLDTRVGPNVQRGTGATTAILENGKPVVAIDYSTWIVP